MKVRQKKPRSYYDAETHTMRDVEACTLVIEHGDHPLALITELQKLPTFADLYTSENGVRIEIVRTRSLTAEEQAEHDRVIAQRQRNEEIRAELAARHQVEWLRSRPMIAEMRRISEARRWEKHLEEVQALRAARTQIYKDLDACRDQAAIQDFLSEIEDIDNRLALLKIVLNSEF